MCVTVLQWKCSLAILKWRNVKTWTTLSTFFTFFWHDTSKKRKKSRFLNFQKNVKNVFLNNALHYTCLLESSIYSPLSATVSSCLPDATIPCILGEEFLVLQGVDCYYCQSYICEIYQHSLTAKFYYGSLCICYRFVYQVADAVERGWFR